jgi:hypothetical protein
MKLPGIQVCYPCEHLQAKFNAIFSDPFPERKRLIVKDMNDAAPGIWTDRFYDVLVEWEKCATHIVVMAVELPTMAH